MPVSCTSSRRAERVACQRRRSTSARATALRAAPANTRGLATLWRRCIASIAALPAATAPASAVVAVPGRGRCTAELTASASHRDPKAALPTARPRLSRNISGRWARKTAVSAAPASATRLVSCMPAPPSPGGDEQEALRAPSLTHSVLFRVETSPAANPLRERVPVVVLAGMAAQRLQLAVHCVGDVDDGVALGHGHQVHLVDGVRLEALVVEQLHVRKGVACVRVHRAQRRLAGRPVV